MSEKLNLPLKEVTFSRFQFQGVSLQAIEYGRELVTMLFEHFRKDEDIVQIYQTDIVDQTGPDHFHYVGELTWCIT